jgi:hypothetical protein
MLWLEVIVMPTPALRSVVSVTEFVANLTVKPVGAVLFSVTVSLPLDAAGRGTNVRLG